MDLKKKNKKNIHPQMYTRSLSTDRHWNQEAEGWPNIPVHHSSQTHTQTTRWASEALQVFRVDLWDAVIFTYSIIVIFRQIEDQGYNLSQS